MRRTFRLRLTCAQRRALAGLPREATPPAPLARAFVRLATGQQYYTGPELGFLRYWIANYPGPLSECARAALGKISAADNQAQQRNQLSRPF